MTGYGRRTNRIEGAMTGLIASGVEKCAGWIHRFLTEVIASVATTACVAGATTIYFHMTAVPDAPTRPPADIAQMLSPVVDSGATRFVAAGDPASEAAPAIALPPARPKNVPAAPKPVVAETAATPRQPVFASTSPPIDAVALFGPAPEAARPAHPEEPGRSFEPERFDLAGLPPKDVPEPAAKSLEPAPGPEANLLEGDPVSPSPPQTGLLPNVVSEGVRGLGAAMGRLIP
jgi:hypothetical protein